MYTEELLSKLIVDLTKCTYKNLTIDSYILQGDTLKIDYSYLRDDITDLDIEYNTTRRRQTYEILLLEYITFIFNLKTI